MAWWSQYLILRVDGGVIVFSEPRDVVEPMISITGWDPSASYTSREVKPPAAIVVHPEHSPDQCPDV